MPDDWLAVEVDANGACLYWREEVTDENVDARLDAVARVLESLLQAHVGTAVENHESVSED